MMNIGPMTEVSLLLGTIICLGAFFLIDNNIPAQALHKEEQLLEDDDDLADFSNAVRNGDNDLEEIQIQSMEAADIYNDADDNMKDCIGPATEVGHSLSNREVIHCVDDANYFQNKYSSISTNSTVRANTTFATSTAVPDTDNDTAIDTTSTSDTSASDTSASNTSTSDTSIPDIPTSNTSTSDTSASNTSTSDTSASDTSASDTSIPDIPTSDTSIPDIPTSDTSASDTSIADIPTSDTSTSDISTSDDTSSNTSTNDTQATSTNDTQATSTNDTQATSTNDTQATSTNDTQATSTNDTTSSNNEENQEDSSDSNNNGNPEDYDSLNDLVNDIKDGVVDTDEISLNNFQNSGAYQGADEQTQDCIDLAGKIGSNLIDYEIVRCSEDPNHFKNQIANNDNSSEENNDNNNPDSDA
jgi:hypothetical protein